MTTIVIYYLFNLFIFAFVLIVWVTFIRNLIRGARKDTRQSTQTSKRNQWDKAPTQTVRQMNVDSAQTYSRSQSKRNKHSQSQSQNRKQSWQEMLSDNPQELYQLLRDNLPDSYEKEIKAIFKSQRPMMELMKFLRRKDVWPVLQSLPRKIKSSETRKTELFQTPKSERPLVSTSSEEERPYYEEVSDLEKDALVLSQEIDAVINEYDGYANYFDSLLNEIPKSSVETRQSLSNSRRGSSDTKRKIVNQKWLRNAVIATVILEKPEY